jgi:hypothetical protein
MTSSIVARLDRRDGSAPPASLERLWAAGLVRRASERVDQAVERSLPVVPALQPLFPGGCLRRGSTVSLHGSTSVPGTGATSLLFAVLAAASAAGSWCAVVGLPRLGLVAAVEAGVAIERLALVPHPGPDWVDAVGALIDGLDIVAVGVPGRVAPRLATRITARARQRGAVLVVVGTWPGADVTLQITAATWHGLGAGVGRLRRREVEVVASGRGAATRLRRARLWLPGPSGSALPLTNNHVSLDEYRERVHQADARQRRAS